LDRAYHQGIYGLLATISLNNPAWNFKSPKIQPDCQLIESSPASSINNSSRVNSASILRKNSFTPISVSRVEHFLGYIQYKQRVAERVRRSEFGKKGDEQDLRASWLRYRLPTWLANKVWEVYNDKTRDIWNFNLRVYNVVPRDALIFDFIHSNNIHGIKTLFARKEASPFDREDLHGRTPLHVRLPVL